MRTPAILALALLAACKGGGGPGDDTDDTDSVVYEDGCIVVDGGRGYAKIEDAVTVAPDGAVITLCDKTTGAIVVADKAVTITGLGVGASSWTPPVNEPAITVSGGGSVTISGVTFAENTRSGVLVDGGTFTGTSLQILSPDNYGVESHGGDVTLDGVEVTEATWGAFEVDGGSFSLANGVVSAASAFGVHATNKADVTVKTTTFSATTAVDGNDLSDGSLDDGFAIAADDSAIVRTDGNTFVGNLLGDVFAVGNATVDLKNDTSTGALISLWFDSATAKVTGYTATDYLQYGIVAQGQLPLELTDVTLETTHEGSAAQLTFDDFSGSYGVIAIGPDVTMTGGRIAGHNGGGFYQSAGSATSVLLTATGTVIDDNYRWGLVTFSGDMTVTDVTVSRTLADDLTCYDDSGSIVCNMALSAWNSDLVMSGGRIEANEGFSFAPLFASATVDGTTITGNLEYGMFGYQVAFTGTNLVIEANGQWPLWFQTQSSALIQNSQFIGNSFTQVSEWSDSSTGDLYRYESGYAGNDLGLYDSTVVLEDNTHTGGDGGIYASLGELEIRGDTFEDYNDQVVYGYDSSVIVDDVKIDGVGGYPLFCSSGSFSVSGLEVHDINHQKYSYAQYKNDELQYSGEGEYAGQGIYLYDCDFSADDLTIDTTSSRALYAYDSSVEIDGFELKSLNAEGYSTDGAIYVNFSSDTTHEASSVVLNAVTITDVKAGHAIYVYGSRTGYGDSVEITDATIGDENGEAANINNNAVYAYGVESLSMSGFDIYNTGGSGLYLQNTNAYLLGKDSGREGRIFGAGGHGIETSGASIEAVDIHVEGATKSGLYLPTGEHNLTNVTVGSADRYGMECSSSTTFATCDSVDVTGDLGDVLTCTCG